MSYLRYLLFVRLYWLSNTYCVVFFVCFSVPCVPYVASLSGLSIFDFTFGILYITFIILNNMVKVMLFILRKCI